MNLMRMAILLALTESPKQEETAEALERRVAQLLELGEEEIRRRGIDLFRGRRMH